MKHVIPVLALAFAGCIDFVEPDLPELGAPAVIQATIRLTDRGDAEVEALLAPGLDEAGLRRGVARDTVLVLGRAVTPDSIARNGSRRYRAAWTGPETVVAEPVTFRAPQLEDPAVSPPELTWTGVQKTGADTLEVVAGEDLILEVRSGPGTASPAPDIRQWFLRLEGDEAAFNISSDGPPPDTIHVPARWIPAGDTVAARLVYAQSAVIESAAGGYVGLITLDIRLHWTILLRSPAMGAR